MKSQSKIKIDKFYKEENAPWVVCTFFEAFGNGHVEHIPSFEDLARQWAACAIAEEEKYWRAIKKGTAKGVQMTLHLWVDLARDVRSKKITWEILEDNKQWKSYWDALRKKYQLPR